MTYIDVHIHFDTDRAPDPTNWGDWVVLGVVVLSILIISVIAIMVTKHRKKQVFLIKHPWHIVLMCIGATVQIAAAFVSNGHLLSYEWFRTVMNLHCPLFDYWLQYAFGFGLWYYAMVGRILTWLLIFHTKLVGGNNVRKRSIVKAVVGLGFEIWVICICMAVEISGASQVDPNFGWCMSDWKYKANLILWLLTCCVFMWAAMIVLRKRGQKKAMAYTQTFQSLLLWTLFFIPMLLVNVSGVLSYWWGRDIFTLGTAFMHVFALVRLTSYPLSRVCSKYYDDRLELEKYFNEITENDRILLSDAEKILWIKELFIDHAKTEKDLVGSSCIDEEFSVVPGEKEDMDDAATKDKIYVKMKARVEYNTFNIKSENHSNVHDSDHIYNAERIVTLFYECLELIHMYDTEISKATDEFPQFLEKHFPIKNKPRSSEIILCDEVSTGEYAVGATIADRKNHTLPLEVRFINQLYDDSLNAHEPDLRRIHAFAMAVIERFWYNLFMSDEIIQSTVCQLFERKGYSSQAVVEDGLMNPTSVRVHRAALRTQYSEVYPDDNL